MAFIRKYELPFVIVLFVFLVYGLVALRVWSEGSFTVTNADILVALIPVAVWLLASGRIQELGFGQFKVVAAISSAANEAVASQVTKLPVSKVSTAPKAAIEEIERLRRDGIRAITFRIGTQAYADFAIEEYFQRLACTLRYIVFEDDDRFFGVAEFHAVRDCILGAPGNLEAFTNRLREGNRQEIAALPTFVGLQQAVEANTRKTTALEQMEKAEVAVLPVLDEFSRRFEGVVERSRLVASMLLEISARLESRGGTSKYTLDRRSHR